MLSGKEQYYNAKACVTKILKAQTLRNSRQSIHLVLYNMKY